MNRRPCSRRKVIARAFAAAMIACKGIVGLSLLIGAVRFKITMFNAEGTGAALATVATLATLSLVVPTFTTSRPGPEFSPAQLAFAAIASLVLYGAFVLTQTVRHRDFFLPVTSEGVVVEAEEHANPPSTRAAVASLALLLVALTAVVGLAKVESPSIEAGVAAAGLPASFVGVVIALLVLLSETLAASRNALRDRIQTSLNLALGSAMASIGLTIPTIAVATIWIDRPLLLGLGATQIVLLTLTIVVAVLTVVPGRATRLQGIVHLVLLALSSFSRSTREPAELLAPRTCLDGEGFRQPRPPEKRQSQSAKAPTRRSCSVRYHRRVAATRSWCSCQ
jgi:Ca2+:H+ antiporter